MFLGCVTVVAGHGCFPAKSEVDQGWRDGSHDCPPATRPTPNQCRAQGGQMFESFAYRDAATEDLELCYGPICPYATDVAEAGRRHLGLVIMNLQEMVHLVHTLETDAVVMKREEPAIEAL